MSGKTTNNNEVAIAAVAGAATAAATAAALWWLVGSDQTCGHDQTGSSRSTTEPPSAVTTTCVQQQDGTTASSSAPACAAEGFVGLVGNTPLVHLKSLSAATGCTILAKAEFLNPGGSPKDRVAVAIIEDAERRGALKPGGTVYEGTVGSTGISLAQVARAKGYKCTIFMPDDQALEKSDLLTALGATVTRVRPVSFAHPDHFCNLAAKAAAADPNGYYCDQFENPANWDAHYRTTGPEVWEQTSGAVDALVMGAGTGGTLAGVSRYVKEQNPNVRAYLVDPPGSGLYNLILNGVCYAPEEAEGKRRRHQVDTITEGVGLNRVTHNFSNAVVDDAIKATDQEVVDMANYLVSEEGLFVGSSSALNCVGAVRVAQRLGPGHTIVTVLCDSGTRHMTKFWSASVLEKEGLVPSTGSWFDGHGDTA